MYGRENISISKGGSGGGGGSGDLAKNVGIEKKGPALYACVMFFYFIFYITNLLRLIECKISQKRFIHVYIYIIQHNIYYPSPLPIHIVRECACGRYLYLLYRNVRVRIENP